MAAFGGPPRCQDGADGGEEPFKVGRLVFEELANVDAGCGACAPKRDDVLDLGKCQPETPPVAHEREEVQDLYGVDAVARGPAARGRHDPASLVQPQRPAADAAPNGHFADE